MAASDDDYMFDMDYDENNFEYGEESNSETDADLENQYYKSKLAKECDEMSSLEAFQKVLDLQGEEKCEWGFKSLKQMIKILFKSSHFGLMLEKYRELLSYLPAVTRNQSDQAVNSILNYISISKNTELLCAFYELTIEELKKLENNRLWFKINTKLGKLYYELNEFDKLDILIKELHLESQTCDRGENMGQKGSQLLDIYALEIQMYSAQNNYKKLRQIYEKSLNIQSSLPYPLTLGTIRECGGKMNLKSGDYTKALIDFYEAFKNYDEAGSWRRCICLKYLILAAMVAKSSINPLDSQDTRQFHDGPQVKPIAELYYAYRNNDLVKFEEILSCKEQSLCDDALVNEYIDVIHRDLRISKLLSTIKPYKTIRIPYISSTLNIDVEEAEHLIVSCILDNIINGKIDQINSVLIINQNDKTQIERYKAVAKLGQTLNHLQSSVCDTFV